MSVSSDFTTVGAFFDGRRSSCLLSRFLTVLLWRRACFPTAIDSGSSTSSMAVEISPTALGGQLVSVVAHGDV